MRERFCGRDSALVDRLIDEDRLWSCDICARRHTREGVKGGRRSCAVAVTRGWVVCAAKQGQQQHRELQRTVQRTWSPTERYSASRVVPVTRRHSEGVRCSGVEHFFVRGHRIAPFARGRPSLEKRERGPRRPSKARDREMGVQRGTLAMRATRKYDHMVMPVPNGVQLH